MIPRLHALVDAFAHLNRAFDPTSDAYRLRNPLMLKAFHPKHEKDDKGFRVFKSFTSGYDNGILDARIKCSGKGFLTKIKLTLDSPLRDLVCAYGNPPTAARSVKNFLRVALNDDTISENQPLGWFLEDEIKKEKE